VVYCWRAVGRIAEFHEIERQVSTFEFHVARAARERYEFDDALFGLSGNVVLADFAAARRFAQQINQQRDLAADPSAAVRPGDINAMGLVDEILHYVVGLYRRERNPGAMSAALIALEQRLSPQVLEQTLEAFVADFPNVAVHRGEESAADWLASTTDGTSNREIALEELLMLWLANGNPAFAPYGELFDDRGLEEGSAYIALTRGLESHFKTQPTFGPDDDDLITLLRRPALEATGSLTEQLRWIRDQWGFVAERFGDRLVISLDVLGEEERAVWLRFNPTQGGARRDSADGDAAALHGFSSEFSGETEVERFSQDLDWMPRVVLIAKSTYVWLDQLSRQFGRPIWRLDQVPDDELDRLQRAGFTGLWLIGLWERSQASRTIKQMRGNPEAVASAYSLMDYRIAEDLGGDEAYRNLRDRAWARGIRLASDMVPNHMGVDSRWVVEHPDWFMARSDPPYPAYSYNGPNLSADPRVGIYLEDHYFDNTDAAVTFKRVDHWSGDARYIYHGNDGTSMPWNDTAQLDYLKPEVREAVIQTILHVARQFPIIRFDAAMTLAKRHIARLWYPEPGSGGAIPSRAEYALRKADFDRAMPVEFWREVVDRVAREAPDTLLLAEAFWLMEGYFVRTLGMHRVYNSAFMNMMRDEKNAEYRLVIKNTLEFDSQILKRYVNFMNNPDERTAVDQFGKGDKYFGVATVLATMPGLPMFGHGQIEGYGERYGMEYRRAYLEETPDVDLVARHEREIFPLIHQRGLFAEVENFALYDFVTGDGSVNEDVFAFSNSRDGQRSLVVYHNRYAETSGSIRTAAVTGSSLAHGLGLTGGADDWLIMRDDRSGLEHLRSQRELVEHGLPLTLHAYETQVYTQLRDVHGHDGRYGRLADWLGGRAVPFIDDAMLDLELKPLHDALRSGDEQASVAEAAALLEVEAPEAPVAPGVKVEATADELAVAKSIEALVAAHQPDMARGKWIYDWLVDRVWRHADLIALQLDLEARSKSGRANGRKPTELLADDRFRRSIGVNKHDGVAYFNRELFDEAVAFMDLADSADLKAAAQKARYRFDELKVLLAEPPKWASTGPLRRTKPVVAPKPRVVARPAEKTPSKSVKK
jgi:glycosidase